MESYQRFHHHCMRFLVFFIFLFVSNLYAQTNVKFSSIVRDLNYSLMENNLFRGFKYNGGFNIDSAREIHLSYNANYKYKHFNEKLIRVLKDNIEILSMGSYRVNVYWDDFSSSVYSSVVKYEVEEGFPNYTLLTADSRGGNAKLIKDIREDIVANLTLDSLLKNRFSYELYNPIEIAVDKEGRGHFLKLYSLESFIDSSHINRWSPALYYGSLRNSIVGVKYTFDELVSGEFYDVEVTADIFYLDTLFQDELVYFEEQPKEIPKGTSVVSFVLNANSNTFENPLIHVGEISKSQGLIKWIENYDFNNLEFYWCNIPDSKRVFFYTR